MAIYRGSGAISGIYYGSIAVAAVYRGEHRIWPDEEPSDLLSCYATGRWLDGQPWTDGDAWKDV